ncbi:MAG: hypothetical protein ACRDXE_01645 [Acidimicrobiales bacterium]
MSTGPRNLYDLATTVRDAIVAGYATDGVAAPPITYICGPREPSAMCDALVVGWARVFHGTPGPARPPAIVRGTMVARSTELIVWVFRCLTDVLQGDGMGKTVFDPVKADADAAAIMTDAYVVHRGLVRAHAAGELRDYTQGLSIGDAQPLAAEGGIAGIELRLTMELS